MAPDNKAPVVIDDTTGPTDPSLHQDPATGSWVYDDITTETKGQM